MQHFNRNSIMDKSKTKTKYDAFRARIIREIMEETGYSQSFVREAIKGGQKSLAAEDVRKDFNKRYAKPKEILQCI